MKYCYQYSTLLLLGLTGLTSLASHGATHRYELVFAEDGRSVQVTAQFTTHVRQLKARHGQARKLQELKICDGPAIRYQRGKHINLPKNTACIAYVADLLPENQTQTSRWGTFSNSEVLITTPSSFLFLPELNNNDRVDILVRTNQVISVPWVRNGARKGARNERSYTIVASPESSTGLIVLGRFHEIDLSAIGLEKKAVFVGAKEHLAKISTWLESPLAAVSAIGGRLPNPQAQVLAFDVGMSDRSPVPFGYVIRDQGEAVRFYVDASRSLQDLQHDWTASHEFSHLLLPYVRSQQKWISEGFASYYQNVLQTRQGHYSEVEGWRLLAGSFASAQAQNAGMSPNGTAHRDFWQARMMIYWSGAAMALHADTLLRERSEGARSLDTVLGRLSECCLPSAHDWKGVDLFAKLDTLGGEGVFMQVYQKYADQRGMPPTKVLFGRLGIEINHRTVLLDDTAELAHIRRAIMQVD